VEVADGLPVNVLALAASPGVAHLAELGVRRISLGSGLAKAAWGGLERAALTIRDAGDFSILSQGPATDLNALLRTRSDLS